jgi:uncharacterized protein YlxP (DUF503 family)
MGSRTRKHKQRVTKGLAIASSVILLLIFGIKEVLKDNLKDLRDSIGSAESLFRVEEGQSTLSLQIFVAREQAELDRLKSDPHRDFSSMIAQASTEARQAKGDLDVNFDSVSRLIDKLPSGARDLRQLRDTVRQAVEKTDHQVDTALARKSANDNWRFAEIKMAMLFALVQEISVTLLGDAALTAAQKVESALETLVRICSRAIYILMFTLLCLGIYAAITGRKTDVG